jgi:hypothetical protein
MMVMKTKVAFCAVLACLTAAIGCKQTASPEQQTESTAPEAVVRDAPSCPGLGQISATNERLVIHFWIVG